MSATQQAARPFEKLEELLPLISGYGYKLEYKHPKYRDAVMVRHEWLDIEGCHALWIQRRDINGEPAFRVWEGLYKDMQGYEDQEIIWDWQDEPDIWRESELVEKLDGKLNKFLHTPPPESKVMWENVKNVTEKTALGTIAVGLLAGAFIVAVDVIEKKFQNKAADHDNQAITAPAKPDSGPAVAP